jgi:hypothetical protein
MSITGGDPAGNFALAAPGNLTVSSAGATNLLNQTGVATITISGSNASGSDTGTETINYAPSGGLADGLANASGGTAQLPTILNSYGGVGARNKGLITGKQYQPWWNVAGVDYAVGPKSGTTFKDGTNSANLPAGVTISSGCITVATSGTPLVVDSFDFTGLTGAGTGVVFNITGTGKVTVQNCKFKVPTNFSTGSQFMIRCDTAAWVIFQYCDVDGSGAITGPAGWPTQLFAMNGAARQEYYYNFVHNIPFDGIYPSNNVGGNLASAPLARYNVFAWCSYTSAAHFDTCQVFGGGNAPIWQFNTMYQPVADQNSVTLGPVNSFYRVGDVGSSTGLTAYSPESGWNIACGAGQYLSIMQWTLSGSPSGAAIANATMHDNFFDVGNVTNFWSYDTTSAFSANIYDNNMCLNVGGLLPSQLGGGTSWNPSFLNGGSLPAYRAPYSTAPVVNSIPATLHTTTLTAGQAVCSVTATNSPTIWSDIADPRGWFNVDNSGNVTLTAAGVSDLQGTTGKAVITLMARNNYALGGFGWGTVDLTLAP